VVVGGGLLSALFVNDTVCLVVTPVLLAALGPLRVRPTPYLLGLAMGANVGSVLSITGNPQNMLVGIWSGATFGGFLMRMLPVGVGGLAITYGCLRWAYRDELREPFREGLETVPVALDRPLVAKGLALFAVAVIAWLAGGSLPLVAITAGAAMVAVAQRHPAYAIHRVEWAPPPLFAPLFALMRGLAHTGAVAWTHRRALGVPPRGPPGRPPTGRRRRTGAPAMMRRGNRIAAAAYRSCTGPPPRCAPNTSAAHVPTSTIAANSVKFMSPPHDSA